VQRGGGAVRGLGLYVWRCIRSLHEPIMAPSERSTTPHAGDRYWRFNCSNRLAFCCHPSRNPSSGIPCFAVVLPRQPITAPSFAIAPVLHSTHSASSNRTPRKPYTPGLSASKTSPLPIFSTTERKKETTLPIPPSPLHSLSHRQGSVLPSYPPSTTCSPDRVSVPPL
jgi:hypothetical protein